MPAPARIAGRDPMRASQFSVVNAAKPEDLAQPLYDRVSCASTTVPSQLSLFSVQLGGTATLNRGTTNAAVTKTRRDTNLDTSGVVPTKLYQFVGISIAYIPQFTAVTSLLTKSVPSDINILKQNGWLDFKIIDKPILQIPLMLIPEAMPINTASSTENAMTIIGTGITSAVPFPMYKLGIPVTLNPFESFSLTLNFDGTLTTINIMDIQVYLHAFMRRPT